MLSSTELQNLWELLTPTFLTWVGNIAAIGQAKVRLFAWGTLGVNLFTSYPFIPTPSVEELSTCSRSEKEELGCRRGRAEKSAEVRRQAPDGNINGFLQISQLCF